MPPAWDNCQALGKTTRTRGSFPRQDVPRSLARSWLQPACPPPRCDCAQRRATALTAAWDRRGDGGGRQANKAIGSELSGGSSGGACRALTLRRCRQPGSAGSRAAVVGACEGPSAAPQRRHEQSGKRGRLRGRARQSLPQLRLALTDTKRCKLQSFSSP